MDTIYRTKYQLLSMNHIKLSFQLHLNLIALTVLFILPFQVMSATCSGSIASSSTTTIAKSTVKLTILQKKLTKCSDYILNMICSIIC